MLKTIERKDLGALLTELSRLGYTVVGPQVRDEAIVYDTLESIEELPIGWTDEQEAGEYRLQRRDDQALFGYVVGPHSWKKYLHPPEQELWRIQRAGDSAKVLHTQPPQQKYAFLGVRACELAAIAVQDKVFLKGDYVDSNYKALRESALLIAINCGQAAKTCFCASMNTGPRANKGFDLALTEVLEKDRHYFVCESGSERGEQILEKLPGQTSVQEEIDQIEQVTARAVRQMGRKLETDGIQQLLSRNYEHPRWDEVADRCLSCANCTLVCPTCFCTSVEDVTDLEQNTSVHVQKWDSCFNMDFSYIHGGSVRRSTKSRYRQWLTHKLATWIDQFGTSGCVGCGRCITWCPVGIDITEEVQAIRDTDLEAQNKGESKGERKGE